RNFTREEDRPNTPGVALASYGFWRSRFAGDSNVIGRTIQLDGQTVSIIGVLPQDFELPTLARVDLLVPLRIDEAAMRRRAGVSVVRAFGRLKAGVTIPQAYAALQPVFQDSLAQVPAQFRKDVVLRIRSLRDRQVEDSRRASWLLFGAVT